MVNLLKGLFKAFTGGTEATKEGTAQSNYTKEANIELRQDEEFSTTLYQHYGFTSRPPADVECIFLRDGNLTMVIAEDDGDNRPLIDEHEACIYTDKTHYIKIDKNGKLIQNIDGDIAFTPGSGKNLMLGNTSLTGLRKLIDERIVSYFNGHTHPIPILTGTVAGTACTITGSIPGVSPASTDVPDVPHQISETTVATDTTRAK